jgi:hypothetical protein
MMTNETAQILRDLLTMFFGGAITFAIQHYRSRQDKKDAHADRQAETIAKQGKTLSDAFDEIDELRDEQRKSDRRQRITWVYMIQLIEGYGRHGLTPDAPPKELETDPELMRLLHVIKERNKANETT